MRPENAFAGIVRTLLGGCVVVCAPAAAKDDWPQFGFDAQHSGFNRLETEISQRGAGIHSLASLHALYHVPLKAYVNGSPILLADVPTPLGPRDLLYMLTLDGKILARDAADGSEVWSQQPLAPPYDVSPWGFGISSTPAAGPDRAFVYAYAFDGKIHKWAAGTGIESVGDGWPEVVTLKPTVEKASGSLTVATTADGHHYLYAVTSAFYGDGGDYQGHVTTIDLDTGTQNVFNAMCSDLAVHFADNADPDCDRFGGGIWGRGGLVFDDATQRIYATSGNGRFDADTGGRHFADSVLALSADGRGSNGLPLDSYTPANYANLEWGDEDLGAVTLAIVPPIPGSRIAHLGAQGGKDGTLRLIDLDDMSGAGAPAHTGGELSVAPIGISETVTPQMAVWTDPADGVVYLGSSTNDAYRIDLDAEGNPSLVSVWPWSAAERSSLAIANDVAFVIDGTLTAIDPPTRARLWSGTDHRSFAHWQSAIVVNARIYYTDEYGTLSAYGLGGESIFDGDFEFWQG